MLIIKLDIKIVDILQNEVVFLDVFKLYNKRFNAFKTGFF